MAKVKKDITFSFDKDELSKLIRDAVISDVPEGYEVTDINFNIITKSQGYGQKILCPEAMDILILPQSRTTMSLKILMPVLSVAPIQLNAEWGVAACHALENMMN
jgi:hypothetical protein